MPRHKFRKPGEVRDPQSSLKLYLPEDTYLRLYHYCYSNRRTMSSFLRELVTRELDRLEAPTAQEVSRSVPEASPVERLFDDDDPRLLVAKEKAEVRRSLIGHGSMTGASQSLSDYLAKGKVTGAKALRELESERAHAQGARFEDDDDSGDR